MRCLRIYATPDGASHFGEAEIPTHHASLFPGEAAFELSARVPASTIRFVRIPPGVRTTGFHNPPGRVLTIWLDGVVEFETSEGEKRQVAAGEFVLAEDTHGKGHMSRHPANGQNVVLIALPSGLAGPET